MKLLKYKIPDTIEEYCSIRIKASKEGYSWSNDILGYMIFEQKKTTTRKAKTSGVIIHDINSLRKVCKYIDNDKLQNVYRDFREARFEKHKDTVTERAETLIFKKLGKYHIEVAIDMLEQAIEHGWKGLVEDEVRRSKIQAEIKERQARAEEEKQKQEDEKRKQELMETRKSQAQRIQETGKTKDYWEEQAKQELIKKGIKKEFMGPLLPTTINRLVNEYITNK